MKLKKISALLMSAVLAVTMCGCNNSRTGSDTSTATSEESSAVLEESSVVSDTTSTPDAAAEIGFKVDGAKLLDAKGNEFVMRGVNHSHVWFRSQLDAALDGIAATGSNCVRIVLADGDQWDRIPADELETVIKKCTDRKMIVIAEVHDATGKDQQSFLDNAVDYWIEVKDVMNAHTDTVILNIANEWLGNRNANAWKTGYTTAIPKLREAGIKNTIMVDSAGWGQNGEVVGKVGQEVFDSDPDKNTMFSVHMYGSAGKNAQTITNNIKSATDKNLCIVVGEFGYKHSDGDVDEAFIMKYCNENGIGYIGWSWKGNGGGVEYLDISKDWAGTMLSEDWGEILVNGENGIKKTAKVCSVFE